MIALIFSAVLLAELDADLGSGRLVPTIAAVVGLIGVIIGGAALARLGHGDIRRTGAFVASALGLISLVMGGMHAAYAAGGFGTGNGLAGAYAAIGLGLISAILGVTVLINLARRA